MIKINCLLVDDEPLALDLLETYVSRTPFLKCLKRCSSAIEAMGVLHSQQVDLIFLDIQMPEWTGIEFSKVIEKNTRIIFTTAFNEYAIDGYKVNALDYLLKPFNYEEFLNAANKAKEWYALIQATKSASPNTNKDFIFVKSEYRQLKVDLDDVIYFEGMKDYIKIWLTEQTKPILSIISLKALMGELPAEKFRRIHRSYIIALDKIKAVERSGVIMSNGTRIMIAEQYKQEFQDFISGRLIG